MTIREFGTENDRTLVFFQGNRLILSKRWTLYTGNRRKKRRKEYDIRTTREDM